MSLIKWEPWGELDRFFEDIPQFSNIRTGHDLAIDMYEEDDAVIVEMQVPGIDGKDIDVSVHDNYLTVSGSREEKKEKKEKQYYSKEIRRGSFERTIRLPHAVDRNNIQADYTDGSLKITLPKTESTGGTKVKVNVKK